MFLRILTAAATLATPALGDFLDDALDAAVRCRSDVEQERIDALADLSQILEAATLDLDPLSPENDVQLRQHESIRRLTTDCLERAYS